MTSNHESDAFEMRFEDAVNTMHTRLPGGEEPNAELWQSIRNRMTRAETADARAIGPDHDEAITSTGRNREMDATLAPMSGGYTLPKPKRLGWMPLIAAGLVGLMIVTSVWFNGGSPGDDRNHLAWAPTVGTPESSPVANGACTVEPLTTDDVLAMVLNPNNGYLRLGAPRIPVSESYWEPADDYLQNQLPGEPRSIEQAETEAEQPLFNPATVETATELETIGNDYLTCLREGTAYQVWGILDPILVQQIVLSNFPVIRSEADLRAYIDTQGPLPFPESDAKGYASLIRLLTSRENTEVVESHIFEREIVGLENVRIARIHVASPDVQTFEYRIYLRELTPGVWVIYEVSPGGTMG